ncbi:MAG: hypothetical protein AAF849_23740 [Bacteroidota bacterium]
MKEQDKLEEYFRSNLADYEEQPSEDLWMEVLPMLSAKSAESNKTFFFILLLLLSLLLSTVVVWSLNENDLSGKNTKKDVAISPQMPKDQLKDSKELEKTETETINSITKTIDTANSYVKTKTGRTNKKLALAELPKRKKELAIQSNKIDSWKPENPNNFISTPLLLSDHTLQQLDTKSPSIPIEKQKKPISISKYIGLKTLPRQRYFYEQTFKDAAPAEQAIRQSSAGYNFHLELEAGLILNHQWYLGVHLSHNSNRESLEFALNESFTQQDIFVLLDGGPRSIPFEQTALFETLEGNLLVAAKTPEIEAGEKTFYVSSQQNVRSQRIGLNAAYKLDAHMSSIMPKIGLSGVFTSIEGIEKLSARDAENVFAVEAIRTSEIEPLQLVNIEGMLGFQAELPISKSRKWTLVAESSYWFDLTPLFKSEQQQILRSNWANGVGIRYHLP